MKEIFKHISQVVSTSIPEIRWVDFDLGQFDEQPLPAVSWPALLVGFDAASFSRLGIGALRGEQLFTLRVGFKMRGRTHSKTPTPHRDAAMEHLDIVQSLITALQDTGGEGFEGISLTGQTNDRRSDFRIYQLNFTASVYIMPCPDDGPFQPPDHWEDPEFPISPVQLCIDVKPLE